MIRTADISYRRYICKSNDSYRRLFWKSNKDAVVASCHFFDRATNHIFDKVFQVFGEYLDAKLLGNHQNSESPYI